MFRNIPKIALILSFASLLNDMASEAIYPLLPSFLHSEIGMSVLMIGLIEGMAESISSLMKIYSGFLADKGYDPKKMVFYGYSVSAFSRPLFAFIGAPWQAFVLRFSDRFAKGVRSAPRDAWLASSATPHTKGFIFSLNRAMDHTGAAIGPLLATAFLFLFPGKLRVLFFLTVIPALALFFLLLSAPKTENRPLNDNVFSLKAVLKTLRHSPRPLRLFLMSFFLYSIGQSSEAFLILRWQSAGYAVAVLPLLWVVLHVVKLLTATSGGRLSDRIGRKPVLLLGWGIFFIASFCLAFFQDRDAVLLASLIYGLHFAFSEGPSKALVSELAHRNEQGTSFGIYNLLAGIAALPASLLAGWLWEKYGFSVVYGFSALMALIAILLLQFGQDRRAAP